MDESTTNYREYPLYLTYEFLGITRVWRWTKDRMQEAYDKGLIVQSQPGTVPRLKRYLDEQEGMPVSDVWTDIRPVQSQSKELLGYPTQKPLALLERIISVSSNAGDFVLDPFLRLWNGDSGGAEVGAQVDRHRHYASEHRAAKVSLAGDVPRDTIQGRGRAGRYWRGAATCS